MTACTYQFLTSTAALRAAAADWDGLWQRSRSTLPTSRAALVAQWIEHFAPRSQVRALVVRSEGACVAALPLIGLRCPLGMRVGHLAGNEWSPAGELLLDPRADAGSVCDCILDALHEPGWPLVVLGGLLPGQPAWRALLDTLEQRRVKHLVRERFRINQVEIGHDWPAYEATRSKSHRRHLRRALAKAEAGGGVRLRVFDQPQSDEIAHWLRRGFELEDNSWKGSSGTSVLRVPGMFDFYLQQARTLAEWQQLRLIFLEHRGQSIAFEYGWASKGVYYSPKVAYNAACGQFSPGQLLRAAWLERLHADAECQLVDFLGPASRATECWATGSCLVSRAFIATRPLGRLLLAGYVGLRPLVQLVRTSVSRPPANPPAATPPAATPPTADAPRDPEPVAV